MRFSIILAPERWLYFIHCLTDCDILMSREEMISQVKYKREIKSWVCLEITKEVSLSFSQKVSHAPKEIQVKRF